MRKSAMYGVLYCDKYDMIGRFSCSACKYWHADKYTKEGNPYKTGTGDCRNMKTNEETVSIGWLRVQYNFGCKNYKPVTI